MKLADKLNPKHTALLVIDIQNDFCSPTGVMAAKGKDVSRMDELVRGVQKLADVCDMHHIPVFYTQQIYDRAELNDLQKEQYDLDGRLITCDIEGDGWEFYGLAPGDDQVYPKYNYNVFSNEKLQKDLQDACIKTLIVTGVSTQICVETAIRNGFDFGYKIVVPEDLVSTTSNDPMTQQRTLILVKKTYGVVTSSENIMSILSDGSSI